jgi:hypothetical protein
MDASISCVDLIDISCSSINNENICVMTNHSTNREGQGLGGNETLLVKPTLDIGGHGHDLELSISS